MNEKQYKDGFTITPMVPSIEMNSKRYELKIDERDHEGFEVGQHLIIQWVNRHNFTIGVRVSDECSLST